MVRSCGAAVLSIFLVCSSAIAQEPIPKPRVLVLAEGGTARAQNYVMGDLRARGYEVVLAPTSAEDDRGQTATAARRMDAIAALRIRDEGLIEIWVAGPSHDPATMRDVVAPFDSSDEARADAVVRALELLRAHLIEVRTAPQQHRRVPQPVAPVPEVPRAPEPAQRAPSPARLALSAGAGLVHAMDGAGTAMGVPIEARYTPAPAWGIGLGGFVPLRGGTVSGPEATATVFPTLIGASAWHSPWRGAWVTPLVDAGLSLAVLSMTAEASPGYTGRSETVFSGLVHVGVGVAVPLSEALAVRAGVRMGGTVAGDRIRFMGRQAGAWGPIVASTSLSLEWVL